MSLIAIAVQIVGLVVIVVVLEVAAQLHVRGATTAAADLAALAAATAHGDPSNTEGPTAAATTVAARNGATMQECACSNLPVHVTVARTHQSAFGFGERTFTATGTATLVPDPSS